MLKQIPDKLSGVFAAVTTPFDAQGNPALEALDAIVDFGLDNGLKGLCLGGATGEYSACSVEHRLEVFQRVARRAKGRAELICAIGGEHVGHVKQLARAAVDCGAIALLFPPPGFLPYAQDNLVDIMGEVSSELPLPVLIYHIPQCTRDLGLANILRLVATVPNIIGLKDSSGQKANLPVIHAALAQGPMVFMIGSDDLLFDAFELGAVGSISGIAGACPDLILPVSEALQARDKAGARAAQDRLDEFIRHIADFPSPWAMKLALEVRGLDAGALAWPMGPKLSGNARKFQSWFTSQIDPAGHVAIEPQKVPARSSS